MPSGGRRPGAGRPPGSRGQRTLTRLKGAEQVIAGGVSPIEILITHMRDLWNEGTKESKAEACKVADIVAPYVHPRLSAVDMTADQIVEHVVRVPPKSENPETWLHDYMQPPEDEPTVQ